MQCLLSLVLCFFSVQTFAGNESGLVNIKNYTPKEYGAHPQNFCIVQDHRGILYFGNNRGVLEYDGYSWNLIKVKDDAAVFSLLVGSDKLIYTGCQDELGYLKPDKTGRLSYVSLLSKLDTAHHHFGKVLRIFELNGAVYFQCKQKFFKWKDNKFSVYKSETGMQAAHQLGNALYFKLREKGLYKFENESFVPVVNGDVFLNEGIDGVTLQNKKLVVATDNFIYRQNANGEFEKINTTVTNIYNAENLKDKYFSFGLFGDGLVITNSDFSERYRLSLGNGLQDATVNFQFLDRENNLWLALNRGIDKIEILSPVNSFNYNLGLKGAVEDLTRHKGKIYAATYNGVFYYDQLAKRFNAVENIQMDCYGIRNFMLENDTLLIVAANSGVFEIRNNKGNKILDAAPWNIYQSESYRNRLYVCLDDGITSMVRINGTWKEEQRIEGIDQAIGNLAQHGDYVWAGSRTKNVYRIKASSFGSKKQEVELFTEKNGLPDGWVYTFRYKNKILFGTTKGIFEFNENTKTFSRSALNPDYSSKEFGVHKIAADNNGRLWLSVFYPNDNTYDVCYYENGHWIYKPFLKYNSDIVQTIYAEDDEVWMGTANGLMKYDYSNLIEYSRPFKVTFRKIKAGGNYIVNGWFMQGEAFSENQFEPHVFSYSENDLTIEFSAHTYSDEKSNMYQYRLEGIANNDETWKSTPTAVFTNLHEGDYVFKVRARNIYGIISEEAVFRFSILPPWYRTWWAYFGYFILFVAFVYFAIRLSTRGLKKIINERTAEVVAQKEEIEKQKEIVDEKNRDILDSIKYAQRIQETIIPSEELMRRELADDLFVLYQPKDIVSGDFYWMRKFGNTVLFAVVDCTGHGVPGAFVSIVGNNGLNRAVNEFGLRDPAKILDKLSELVEEAFNQKGNAEVRDGMDLALCALNLDTLELKYAGANNPLWILRAGDGMEEFKADKQPIGKFEARKPFVTKTVQLNKGDCIYIFSDGYADQFGGPQGKKFKYKKLQELLLELRQNSMQVQKEKIHSAFEAWKTDYEQLDDVCVIGVRI